MTSKLKILTIVAIFSWTAQSQVLTVLSGLNRPTDLYFQNDLMYFHEQNPGKLFKFNMDMQMPETTLLQSASFPSFPSGLIVNGDDIYLTLSTSGSIVKFGAEPFSPFSFLLTGNTGAPRGTALNGNDIYFAEYNGGRISKVTITDIPAVSVPVVEQLDNPSKIAFDGNNLYILRYPNGIFKVDLDATTPTIITINNNLNYLGDIEAHNGFLYVSQTYSGKILRISITDNSVATIVEGLDQPIGIGFYNDDLYITESTKISKLDVSTLSTTKHSIAKDDVIVYPNPSSELIFVGGLKQKENYQILTLQGIIIKKGNANADESIDISGLSNGIYIIHIENGMALKFLKI